MPWRNTADPFHIWLSEIILQQTRISQGMDYYLRFTGRFQDIASLASASHDEVLKMWQGLGYYSRARNLHQAAQQLVRDYGGKLPEDYTKLLSIKGIGDYTAAAIASIAFNKPYPVLDGNVYRVMARYSLIDSPVNSTQGKKRILALLEQVIDKSSPGTFNQAMMELGAMVCTPLRPRCEECPLNKGCRAFSANKTGSYPVKEQKPPPINRFFHYVVFLIPFEGRCQTLIQQRKTGDIWAGLYEFPLVETSAPLGRQEIMKHPQIKKMIKGKDYQVIFISKDYRHKLTHRTINARFLIIYLNDISLLSDYYYFNAVYLNDLFKYPVSRLTDKFISGELLFNILENKCQES